MWRFYSTAMMYFLYPRVVDTAHVIQTVILIRQDAVRTTPVQMIKQTKMGKWGVKGLNAFALFFYSPSDWIMLIMLNVWH